MRLASLCFSAAAAALARLHKARFGFQPGPPWWSSAPPSPSLPRLNVQAAVIHFAPPEDQRINVTAKLGVPRPVAYAAGSPTKPPAAGGSLTLRWQPSPDVPYTFFDVKARTRGASSAAAVRGCLFDPRSNVAVWAEMPVAATNANGSPAASPGAGLRLGAKYASPDLSVGAVINPAQATLSHAFVVSWRGVALECSRSITSWNRWPAGAHGSEVVLPAGCPLWLPPAAHHSLVCSSLPSAGGARGRAAAGRPDCTHAAARLIVCWRRPFGPPRLGHSRPAVPAGDQLCSGLPAHPWDGHLWRALHRGGGVGKDAVEGRPWAVDN